MAKIYAITHPENEPGFNPGLTKAGKERLEILATNMPHVLPTLSMVVIGTGRRFTQVYEALLDKGMLTGVVVRMSPFLGTSEGVNSEGETLLSNSISVPESAVINLKDYPEWAWKFLENLPDDALLCTSKHFLAALGCKAKKCHLYQVDTETKAIADITL